MAAANRQREVARLRAGPSLPDSRAAASAHRDRLVVGKQALIQRLGTPMRGGELMVARGAGRRGGRRSSGASSGLIRAACRSRRSCFLQPSPKIYLVREVSGLEQDWLDERGAVEDLK
jgi:hypothetical protein